MNVHFIFSQLVGPFFRPAFLVVTVAAVLAGAQQPGTDIYNGMRGSNFDNGWKFNLGDVANAQNTNFADAAWRSLAVPHDWSIELAFDAASPAGSGGGYLNGGIGWYRKTFSLPASDSGKRITIQFDGVYMNSDVWINGNHLGNRPYGFSSFEYDITPSVVFGGAANVLAVKINNQQPNCRWYSGSGIYRHVWLTVLDPVHVAYCGLFVKTPTVTAASATIGAGARVLNQSSAAKQVSIVTTLLDSSGVAITSNTSPVVTIAANGENTFSQTLSVSNPKLWSTDSPYLYSVKTQVMSGSSVTDVYHTSIGIRSVAFTAQTGLVLNGVNTKIKGVCLHHDLGCLGAAINYRALERQLQIMKTMGCNAVRTSHNPPAPELLDLCDRLGLVVLDEAFDCWSRGKTTYDYHLYFTAWAQQDIQDMVRRDRNHPAVILYSIGNEITGLDDTIGYAEAKNLSSWVRAVDSTRLLTANIHSVSAGAEKVINDFLNIAGYSYSTSFYSTDHTAYPSRPMLATESSSALRSRGVYYRPTSQVQPNTTDLQCSSYDNMWPSWGCSADKTLQLLRDNSWVAGQFVWTGFDYIGEPTPYGSNYPSKSSYFGIVDLCGFPKDAYYLFQSQWSAAPMVHVLPHWNWPANDTVPVFVYTNCTSAELFVNGRSLGSKTMGTNPLRLSWTVPFEAGTLRVVAKQGATVVAADSARTAQAAAKIVLKPDRAQIRADATDLVFVEVNVVDAAGVLVPTAANQINFSVSGAGSIVGVDNGNAASVEPMKGSTRKAFNGKCLVVVQSNGSAGPISITASSTGLTSAAATVNGMTPAYSSRVDPVNRAMATLVMRNPYVPGSNIRLLAFRRDPVAVSVFDITGKTIARIDVQNPDRFQWQGKDLQGRTVANGAYVMNVLGENVNVNCKFILSTSR